MDKEAIVRGRRLHVDKNKGLSVLPLPWRSIPESFLDSQDLLQTIHDLT